MATYCIVNVQKRHPGAVSVIVRVFFSFIINEDICEQQQYEVNTSLKCISLCDRGEGGGPAIKYFTAKQIAHSVLFFLSRLLAQLSGRLSDDSGGAGPPLTLLDISTPANDKLAPFSSPPMTHARSRTTKAPACHANLEIIRFMR